MIGKFKIIYNSLKDTMQLMIVWSLENV